MPNGGWWICRALGPILEGSSLQMTDRLEIHPLAKRGTKLRLSSLGCALVSAMLIIPLSSMAPFEAAAHPGGLAGDGCHNDRKNGGRHCHRGPSAGKEMAPASSGQVYYPNCAAARAAGAAPVRRGQPGYGKHLDRDGDGIGCE